jgi:polyisoprenyl-phosphate glycosyltransferase
MSDQSLRPFPHVSVVIPLFNEEEVVERTMRTVMSILDGLTELPGFEVIAVDDGSRDATLRKLRALSDEFPALTVISLSRNFGHQAALSAGIDHAPGDAIFIIDGDLQDDPSSLAAFVDEYRRGADVVYARRVDRKESMLLRAAFSIHYRLLSALSRVEIPLDAGDFALISSQVADVLRGMPERQRYLRGLRAWAGFKQVGISVERLERAAGESKYTVSKLVSLALDGLVSFSIVPLRLASILGLVALAGGGIYGLYSLVVRLTTGDAPVGFTALALLLVGFGGVILLMLGVLGEYIGRIYEEVKARPVYVVKEMHRKSDG